MAIVERPSNAVSGAKGTHSIASATPPRMQPKFSASTMKGGGGSTKTGSAGSNKVHKLPGGKRFKR